MNGQSTNALVGPLDAAQRHGWQSRFQTAATARAVGEVKHIPKHGRKEPVMKKQETKSINEVAGTPSAVAYSDVQRMIVKVRNQHVIIDADVAKLYGVETKRINEAVHNNPDKFPADYMFVLTSDESKTLRSKISSLEQGGKGRHSKYIDTA